MDALVADVADRIFADHVDKPLLERAESGEFPQRLWQVLCEAGLHLVGAQGSGTGLADTFGLLKVAGRHAVPLPLAEVWIAGFVLGDENTDALTVVADDENVAAWGRRAERVLTLDGGLATEFSVERGVSLAGEPRDRIRVDAANAIDLPREMPELMATTRAALAAGALERTLELAIEYATTRSQFGRTISRFQAVQHQLAVLAGEVAAAVRACDGAIEALAGGGFATQAAATKARVGEACGIAAEIAHQVHGAMGFTHEHTLHHFTRRLWSWRDEFGNEAFWQRRLGERLAAAGADGLWDFITREG